MVKFLKRAVVLRLRTVRSPHRCVSNTGKRAGARAARRGAAAFADRRPDQNSYRIPSRRGSSSPRGSNFGARTALRKGTDEAERSRFGGIGMTGDFGAEHALGTRYPDILG